MITKSYYNERANLNYDVRLPQELVAIATELIGNSLHGRNMNDLSDIIEECLAESLLQKALSGRGEFYEKHFNALRRLRFKDDSMQDVPMPKKRRRK